MRLPPRSLAKENLAFDYALQNYHGLNTFAPGGFFVEGGIIFNWGEILFHWGGFFSWREDFSPHRGDFFFFEGGNVFHWGGNSEFVWNWEENYFSLRGKTYFLFSFFWLRSAVFVFNHGWELFFIEGWNAFALRWDFLILIEEGIIFLSKTTIYSILYIFVKVIRGGGGHFFSFKGKYFSSRGGGVVEIFRQPLKAALVWQRQRSSASNLQICVEPRWRALHSDFSWGMGMGRARNAWEI